MSFKAALTICASIPQEPHTRKSVIVLWDTLEAANHPKAYEFIMLKECRLVSTPTDAEKGSRSDEARGKARPLRPITEDLEEAAAEHPSKDQSLFSSHHRHQ